MVKHTTISNTKGSLMLGTRRSADWLRGDMLDQMTFLLTESTVGKVTVHSQALARTKGSGNPDTHSRQAEDFQLSCFYKWEASSFALSPVSTLLITEMAAAPGVSWDLILWRGKREDLRDMMELSGVPEGQCCGDFSPNHHYVRIPRCILIEFPWHF